MPRPGRSKSDILDGLAAAFRSHGYGGASLAVLSHGAGVGKASLYHHFPGGKEEMALAVLARLSERFNVEVLRPLRAEGPLPQRIAGMAAGLMRFYDGGTEPCAIDAFTLGDAPGLVRGKLKASSRNWIGALTRALEKEGVAHEAAATRAQAAVGAVQGALVLSRACTDTSYFKAALERLPELLLEPRRDHGPA